MEAIGTSAPAPVGPPIMLLDAARRVLFANAVARRLIARRGLFAIVDGGLICIDPRCDAELREALHALALDGVRMHARVDQVSLAMRRNGRLLDLFVTLTVLVPEGMPRVSGASRQALLTLHGPMPALDDLDGGPEARFAFTPAERRVAALIRRGAPPKQVADELGIALPTVKSHLQALFGKTGTRRQAELVHVLLTRAPAHAVHAAA